MFFSNPIHASGRVKHQGQPFRPSASPESQNGELRASHFRFRIREFSLEVPGFHDDRPSASPPAPQTLFRPSLALPNNRVLIQGIF